MRAVMSSSLLCKHKWGLCHRFFVFCFGSLPGASRQLKEVRQARVLWLMVWLLTQIQGLDDSWQKSNEMASVGSRRLLSRSGLSTLIPSSSLKVRPAFSPELTNYYCTQFLECLRRPKSLLDPWHWKMGFQAGNLGRCVISAPRRPSESLSWTRRESSKTLDPRILSRISRQMCTHNYCGSQRDDPASAPKIGKIAFIGAGKMAEAMIAGMLSQGIRQCPPSLEFQSDTGLHSGLQASSTIPIHSFYYILQSLNSNLCLSGAKLAISFFGYWRCLWLFWLFQRSLNPSVYLTFGRLRAFVSVKSSQEWRGIMSPMPWSSYGIPPLRAIAEKCLTVCNCSFQGEDSAKAYTKCRHRRPSR